MGSEKDAGMGLKLEVAADMDDYEGVTFMLYVYTFIGFMMAVGPLIVFLVVDNDATGYKAFHQKIITQYAANYGPLIFSLPMFILHGDSEMARMVLMGSLMFAGMGPYGLFWAGFYDFLQKGSDLKALDKADNTLFAILYGCGNVLLLLVHVFLAPGIYDSLKTAKLPPLVVEEPEEEENADEEAEAENADEA